jgi:hypothetical protein
VAPYLVKARGGEMTDRARESSPQTLARVAGALYVITILAGCLALFAPSVRLPANLVAGASYVAVTILFYFLFKPVSPGLSLLAALVSLVGCVWGVLTPFRLAPFPVSPLGFFGFYCLLIGYLVYRSGFLPRILGVLMAIGGVGWLTFLSPSLVGSLAPYNYFPGIVGETLLTLWLLIKGVDVPQWKELEGRRKSAVR